MSGVVKTAVNVSTTSVMTMTVPTKFVHHVIGKGGVNVNAIRSETDVKDGTITISGTLVQYASHHVTGDRAQEAEIKIKQLLERETGIPYAYMQDTVVLEISVPVEYHSVIVGKGGATINAIKQSCKIIDITLKSDKVSIEGCPAAIHEAMKQIVYKISCVKMQSAMRDTLYMAAQQEVDKIARERGALFEASKQAFSSGDGARAKALSEQGHSLTAKMQTAIIKMSDIMYDYVNHNNVHKNLPPTENAIVNDKQQTCYRVDLHGQHVDMAMRLLTREIDAVKSANRHSHPVIRIITGQGKHSEDKALIRPAVLEWSKSMDVVDSDEGSVTIRL